MAGIARPAFTKNNAGVAAKLPPARDNEGVLSRPAAGSVPTGPGAYLFRDAHGRVLYVGKAKSLRSRLSNYFAAPASLPERTRQMVTAAGSVEWI